jgi:hypothetical protein
MQYTLLEMVQNILSSLDGDEVATYNETTESEQVANIIRTTYWDIVSRAEFSVQHTLFELTETSSSTPTMMTLPSLLKVEWIKYNQILADSEGETSPNFQPVEWMPLDEFMTRMYGLSSDDDDVTYYTATVNSTTQDFFAVNDRAPRYYTTFNDSTILFDAFNSDEETYLEAAKTQAYGQKIPTFTMSDSFVADLPARMFSLLYNESKALAFAELKQMSHSKAEKNARRGWINSQRREKKTIEATRPLDQLANYGRK